MKLRTISVAAIALASGLLLSNSHVGRVHADDQHERACSTKTLHGFYGLYRSGTTSTGPLTAVGIIFYDGNGNNTATQTISRNGVFTLDQTTIGQYEVDPDCTGRGFQNGVQISRTVIVDGGKEVYLLSMVAGNAVFGVAKKIHSSDDDR
jgi:hypothetical protein